MMCEALMFGGGVIEPELALLCIEGDRARLECFNISNGERVCEFDETGGRPLIWVEGNLLGWKPQSNHNNIVIPFIADVSMKVAKVRLLVPLKLPDWANANSSDPQRFRISAEHGNGQITIRWKAKVWYEGGAPAPDAVLQECERGACGFSVYDFDSGAMLKSEVQDIDFGPSSEALRNQLLKPPEGVYRLPYRRKMQIESVPWEVKGKAMALWPKDNCGAHGLSLVTQPSTQLSLETLSVTSQQLLDCGIDPAKDEIHISPDGGYIFIGLRSEAKNECWQIFDDEGQKLGEFPKEKETCDIALTGSRAMCLVDQIVPIGGVNRRQRNLKVWDYAEQKLIWSRMLFDRKDEPPPPLPSSAVC